jgi:hypothetical protein
MVNVVVPPQVAVNVPTLSQWAMTLLIVMLAGIGVSRARRSRR